DGGDVGGVEDGRVLERLVFAFGDRGQDAADVFAKVEARGADQVADVFDQQQIELLDRPAFERGLDHAGFEVAERAGRDLADPGAAAGGAGEALGVVVGGEIADEHRRATAAQAAEQSLEQ